MNIQQLTFYIGCVAIKEKHVLKVKSSFLTILFITLPFIPALHFISFPTPSMAAELVGGALLSAFLQVAFDRLASPQLLHFFRRRKLDEKLLANLKIKLLSINALADDAELKQFTDPHVKAWLFAVKEAVFDAEDLLGEIDYELTRFQVEAQYKPKTFTCK
ncbi:hypothetical protein VNO80_14049 [Phaseolus coccineus]|uniref:Disease resistance N-terminal domain-containing protein n=1 Tax=Phaseolus coccineus TaxID=3886 RepID=A0AAN9N1Y9_PHACN